MTSTSAAAKAAIKEMVQARVQLAEALAAQLDRWEQATRERAALEDRIAAEAAAARTSWDQALAGGWTAKELTSAGLKPPAPPRSRTGDQAQAGQPQD